MVHIMDPDGIKEVMTRNNQFQRIKSENPLTRFLVNGFAAHNGDKWAKHRKLINPAFHIEKLKVSI